MQISPRKIGGILLGALVLFLLGASVSLFLFVKYRKGYEAIAFTDVAFPWNWDDLRPKWGDYFIEKGIEHRNKGEWDKAFYFIRVGVSKAPANLEGRLALADLLFQANDVIQAVRVLESGLSHARQNSDFWEKMISFLQYYQADQEIIRILKQGLAEELVPETLQESAESALAKAYYHQARFTEALEITKTSNIISNQIIRCQIYWDQGLESLAIQNLESLNNMFPNQREVVPLLTSYYQKSGDVEQATQLARFTYLNNPYSVGASVNYFRILGKKALEEIERFLERVPEIYENEDALFVMANYLAEAGDYQMLESLLQKASQDFQQSPMVWFLQIEAQVNGGAFDAAVAKLEKPPESVNPLIPLHRILLQGLSLTAYYAKGENDRGNNALQQLFASGHIRPATLLRLSAKLLEINRPQEAGRILQFLLKQNPGNQAALADLIRVDLRMNRTTPALAQSKLMIENKTMPYALKRELITYLASDSQIYQAESSAMIGRILETFIPSKKKQLLEAL
jgi:tetratricopeptide (TPR) repeat protein